MKKLQLLVGSVLVLQACSTNVGNIATIGPNSCLVQASPVGGCSLPMICVDYSGSGWTNQTADTDCYPLTTSAESVTFQAMSGCSGATLQGGFVGIQNCAEQVAGLGTGYTLLGSCVVNSGQSTQLTFNYYNSTAYPATNTNAQSDCGAKGGTYTAG